MTQPRTHSIMETVASTAIGFGVSWAATPVILGAFDMHPSGAQSAGITACFTVLSLVRGYVVRRVANRMAPYPTRK